MPDYNFENPWSGVLQGQQAFQGIEQAGAAGREQRNRNALRDWAAEFGSSDYLSGFPGVAGAERPASLKELYKQGDTDAALKAEGVIAAPFVQQRAADIEGRKEYARKLADARITQAMIQDLREQGLLGGASQVGTGGTGGDATGMMPRFGIRGGQLNIEFDPYAGPDLDVKKQAERRAGLTQFETDRGAIGSRIQQHHQNIRQHEQDYYDGKFGRGAAAQQKLNDKIAVDAQGLRSAQEEYRSLNPDKYLSQARAAPPAAPAPITPPIEEAMLMTKAQETEYAKMQEEARAEKRKIDAEERAHYQELFKVVGNSSQGLRQVLAGSKAQRLLDLQNKNQFGNPLLKLPMQEALTVMGSANAAEYAQGMKTIAQSLIVPGTSGTMNTAAEYQNFLDALGGLSTSPRGNRDALVAMNNAVERSHLIVGFFREMEKRNVSIHEAQAQWEQYMEQSPPYISKNTQMKGGGQRFDGVKNPDFYTPAEWLGVKKAAPAPVAAPDVSPSAAEEIGTIKNGMLKVGENKWAPLKAPPSPQRATNRRG